MADRLTLGLVATAALGLALSFPVMRLWNWLMPAIFGLPFITYWQAVGLLVLSHLLFKGHNAGHAYHRRRNHARWDAFAKRPTAMRESLQSTPPIA